MNAWQVTAAALVSIVALVIVFDLLLVITKRPTFSRVVKDYIKQRSTTVLGWISNRGVGFTFCELVEI